jgi:hypothetical protein
MGEFRGGGGGWSGFGEYMRDKTSKLGEQFDSQYKKRSDLFLGKTFWSTGRLVGFEHDLKKLVTENGGKYEQYGLRRVSHIVASNLALSNQNWKKLLGGKFASKSFCVVKPEWVLDSIEAQKCLSECEYLPDCIKSAESLEKFLAAPPTRTEQINGVRYVAGSFPELHKNQGPSAANKTRICSRYSGPMNTVIDEICFSVLTSNVSFGRRGYVTISHSDSVQTYVLNLESNSLSEELFSAISSSPSMSSSEVILTLYNADIGLKPLDVFPIGNVVHPSSVLAGITHLIDSLIRSDEDSSHAAVQCAVHEAGPSFRAVIIDAFLMLVQQRRLDSARELIHSLRRLSRHPCTTEENIWLVSIESKLQEIFRFFNNGASLWC